ncbi:La-related protein 7 [Mactra antiquata]
MNEPDEKPSDKPRRRMRAAYAKIREQMEFYFSDANLNKDRFLKKLIEATTDGYIPLDTFLHFKRIKALTEDKEVIADSLNNKSDLLKVNEARTHVKRVTKLMEPVNVDERTIYVECIPTHADHDWVRRIFSSCGKVLYVSLPRYQSTGDLKGFAFVEYETIEAAQNACEELNNPPAELHKLGSFPKSSHQIEALRKKIPEDPFNEPPCQEDQLEQPETKTADVKSPILNKESKSKRQRTLSDSETEHRSETDVTPSKRKKSEVTFDLPSEDDDKKSNSSNKKSRKRKVRSKTDVLNEVKEETEQETSENIHEKKAKLDNDVDIKVKENLAESDKKTKNKEKTGKGNTSSNKKKRSRKKKPKTNQELPELRVISKKEWLELRKEYLQLQKASMALLKKTISKKEKFHKQNEDKKKKHASVEFVADVIVKVSSDSPMNRKDLKKSFGEDYNIAYIDIKDNNTEGYIRCKDTESAKLMSESSCTGYTFNMVTGDAEKQYWDKLILDRETKFNSKELHKKRGQQKWMNKAQKISTENTERKHIIFDDD